MGWCLLSIVTTAWAIAATYSWWIVTQQLIEREVICSEREREVLRYATEHRETVSRWSNDDPSDWWRQN